MTIVNLKAQLSILVELQKIDSEIYGLKSKKESMPREIEALKSLFDEKKLSLSNLEKAGLDLAKLKKDRELELGSKDEAIKKLQTQLYQLKTNNEYKTMLKQIDDAKADYSAIEDKILEVMEKIDKNKIDAQQEKNKLEEEEKAFNLEKKKVEEKIKLCDDRLSQLDGQRKQLLPTVDNKILAQYDRILASREGLAIALVNNNSCQGCHMIVPPQVINLIKMYERIITCEVCNRMLYIDEQD